MSDLRGVDNPYPDSLRTVGRFHRMTVEKELPANSNVL